jgi:DNA-binding NtrC family response regulator
MTRIFAADALDFLRPYSFPGNVQELRYPIEQAAILSEGSVLLTQNFASMRAGMEARPNPLPASARRRSRPIAAEITPERLRQVLEQCGGNRVQAARELQISRATLYLLGRDA